MFGCQPIIGPKTFLSVVEISAITSEENLEKLQDLQDSIGVTDNPDSSDHTSDVDMIGIHSVQI